MEAPRLDFVIAGFYKCGTTSLYEYLRRQPGVYLPAQKETGYYCWVAGSSWHSKSHPWIRDPGSYAGLYSQARDGELLGEATPAYTSTPGVAEVLRAAQPGARVIVLVRNPWEQLVSRHAMHVRHGVTNKSLRELLDKTEDPLAIPVVQQARMASALRPWVREFGDSLRLWSLTEIASDPARVLRDVMVFIGADADQVDESVCRDAYNEGAQPRNAIARRLMRNPALIHGSRLLPRSVRRLVKQRILTRPIERPGMQEAWVPKTIQRTLLAEAAGLEALAGRRLPGVAF